MSLDKLFKHLADEHGLLLLESEKREIADCLPIESKEMAGRCYQIEFGNHIRCKIKVTDNGIKVEGAMNGWGDDVPLDEVFVSLLEEAGL
jgi:hypothetical protein